MNDLRLLVVDDDDTLREALANFLKLKKFSVSEARGGYEAFDMLRTQEIDVVISDVQMPEGDGIELLKKILAEEIPTPVIMISGHSAIAPQEAVNLGAKGLLHKPFDPVALIQMIRDCVSETQ